MRTEGRVVEAVIRAGVMLRKEAGRELQEVGLNPVGLEVLRQIEDHGSLSASGLARTLHVRRQSLRALLEGLVEEGVLQVARARADGRAQAYVLSDEGHFRLELGLAALGRLEREFLAAVAPSTAAGLKELAADGLPRRGPPVRTVFWAMR